MMYIKDDSFYEEFRDTTKASLYLMRPLYGTIDFSSPIFGSENLIWAEDLKAESGIFEPIVTPLASNGSDVDIYIDKCTMPESALVESGMFECNALVVVYAVDETGKLLAPPGKKRAEVYPAYPLQNGEFSLDFSIPACAESGFKVESMHLCQLLPVNPQNISLIEHEEKNDIILSSIPHNDLEVELFDEDRVYADFIERAGKKLRVLLHYQYNDVHSDSFVYYYEDEPKHDKSTSVPKTTVRFGGLTDVLSGSMYVNTVSDYTSPFTKKIGTYLQEIANCFRTNYIPVETTANVETPYGGDFFRLESCVNYGQFGIIVNDELETEDYEHHTRTPADGYTFADAIRLLVNAQCHIMRVRNESIVAGPPKYILKTNRIALSANEYYAQPKKEKYANIDQIKINTPMWSVGETAESYSFDFAFKNGGEPFYIGNDLWETTRLEYGKPIVIESTEWKNGNPFLYLEDCSYNVASGGMSMMWKKETHQARGYAHVTVTGKPLEKSKDFTYSKVFGSGKQVFELNNPFLRPRDLQSAYDIPDEYIDFNYKYQSGKTIYTLDARGRFDVHPLDMIQYTNDDGELRYGIVIEHNMKYNGGMRSTIRVVDEGPVEALYVAETVSCDNILICR